MISIGDENFEIGLKVKHLKIWMNLIDLKSLMFVSDSLIMFTNTELTRESIFEKAQPEDTQEDHNMLDYAPMA